MLSIVASFPVCHIHFALSDEMSRWRNDAALFFWLQDPRAWIPVNSPGLANHDKWVRSRLGEEMKLETAQPVSSILPLKRVF
jgi:hypothetical protein